MSDLPPLPRANRNAWPNGWHDLFSAEQMQQYANEAIAADRAKRTTKTAPEEPEPSIDSRIEKLRDLVNIQLTDGTWNCGEYMRGIANGLLVAMSVFDDKAPVFKKPQPESSAELSDAEIDALPEPLHIGTFDSWRRAVIRAGIAALEAKRGQV